MFIAFDNMVLLKRATRFNLGETKKPEWETLSIDGEIDGNEDKTSLQIPGKTIIKSQISNEDEVSMLDTMNSTPAWSDWVQFHAQPTLSRLHASGGSKVECFEYFRDK